MRVFRAYEAKDEQDAAYRLYIGTGVQFIVENTAALVGSGKGLMPYADFFELKPVDNRTGDEIALEVMKKAGLKVRQ